MTFFTRTRDRVTSATPAHVNDMIQRRTSQQIEKAAYGGRAAIEKRLQKLDEEWDIERCLEAGASSLVLTGTFLGTTVNRKWLALPAGVAGFLLQHALQGWCPPLSILRRLGVRTSDEINQERYALKALRGDFSGNIDISEVELEICPAEPEEQENAVSRH